MSLVDTYWFFAQLLLPPLLIGLLVVWMLRAPQSLKAAVTRLWDALMAPITGVQNTLALASQSLQARIVALGATYRSPRVVMGALFCVLAAIFTMPGAAEFLYLTMLGLLGVDAAPLFGMYSGHVMSLSLFVGLAFVFALGLEFMGATHLGLVEDTTQGERASEASNRRRLMAWLTVALLALGIMGLVLLGMARTELASDASPLPTESVASPSSTDATASSPPANENTDSINITLPANAESDNSAKVLAAAMLIVPIFLEFSAAAALWAMFQHTALLFLIVMRLLSFVLALANLIPTILSVIGRGIRDALLMLIDFVGSLYSVNSPSAESELPPYEETLPQPQNDEPEPSSWQDARLELPAHEPTIEPETTPIDPHNLNPLGETPQQDIGGNRS